MKKIIASPHAPKAVGPYSQAVEAGGMLYISGQLPVDGATGTMAEGIEAQTHQSLKNLGHILREAGLDYANVVKTTVLLDSIADFAAMNAIYATYFTSEMPARVCYEVAKLPMGALVEIDAIAVCEK
jgi:2-iminobutanoate/2-iminopropanoate deaminase